MDLEYEEKARKSVRYLRERDNHHIDLTDPKVADRIMRVFSDPASQVGFLEFFFTFRLLLNRIFQKGLILKFLILNISLKILIG